VREQGGLVVAISPQSQRQSDFTAGHHQLPFPLLTDFECGVAEQFGLMYSVPDYQRNYYRSILVNIPFVNGEESWRLPVPATYLIAQDGTVLFAQAYADFRVRPEPEELLQPLLAMRK